MILFGVAFTLCFNLSVLFEILYLVQIIFFKNYNTMFTNKENWNTIFGCVKRGISKWKKRQDMKRESMREEEGERSRERERDWLILRNWLAWLGRLGKPQICRVYQQAGDQGKSANQIQKPYAGRISSCSGEINLCSTKAFKWLAEDHSHYGVNPLYSKPPI